MKEKIQQLIFNSIDSLNAHLPNEEHIEKHDGTALFGSGSKLDSLGLINLIVMVEQNIEDEFDISLTLADERAMSQIYSPFRSVESLTDYINILLKEINNA
jgi:acyl carrier protein